MPIGDFLRRRPTESETCIACGAQLPVGSAYCPNCGVRADDPDSQPLHIVDRATGLFNDRFIRPVLEDELARAHRYSRPLGVILVEAHPSASTDGPEGETKVSEDTLKDMASAIASMLARRPPQLLAVLPDTDMAGTAYAANRVLTAVQTALVQNGSKAAVGLVCVRPGQRFRAGAVIEAAGRSLRSGKPELMGR